MRTKNEQGLPRARPSLSPAERPYALARRRCRSRPSCATDATSVPSLAKIKPREKPRESGEARAVLGVEQPLVGAERAVEPQRVVEARRHDVFGEHAAAVRDQGRVEQHHVGGVSQHALMDRRLVGQPPGGADPDIEAAVLRTFSPR